ncbi:hypothetical protein L596_009119 [Steinernema carpocapsae]|uniref:Uncharacterized protein n=1 Tax=Steinernema carpocapsae TaxID=34508 RepID=A0A4U5PEF6_STECR|nr:hypothetical protein L596_009119 [Steinernema carpocapsae]
MILSTHHMDEADVLADRIAIISEGHLVASGSSLFMKKRFGEGNRLVIAKDPKYITQESSRTEPETTPTTADETMQRSCGERSYKKLRKVRLPPNFYSKLVHFIREKTHGEGKFEEDLRGEIVFRIPLTMYAGDMKILFEALEARKEEFGIKSYGISAPSLQQIFLKIAPVHDLKLRKEGKNCFLALFDKIKGCFQKTNPSVGLTTDTTADDTEVVTTEEQQQVDYDGGKHPYP